MQFYLSEPLLPVSRHSPLLLSAKAVYCSSVSSPPIQDYDFIKCNAGPKGTTSIGEKRQGGAAQSKPAEAEDQISKSEFSGTLDVNKHLTLAVRDQPHCKERENRGFIGKNEHLYKTTIGSL